jgi:hypothetical protein
MANIEEDDIACDDEDRFLRPSSLLLLLLLLVLVLLSPLLLLFPLRKENRLRPELLMLLFSSLSVAISVLLGVTGPGRLK